MRREEKPVLEPNDEGSIFPQPTEIVGDRKLPTCGHQGEFRRTAGRKDSPRDNRGRLRSASLLRP